MVLEDEFPEDERVSKEIQTLVNNDHQVSIACITKQNRINFEKTKSFDIYRIPISPFILKTSVGALNFPFYFNFWNRFLRKVLERNRFDAIHIHDLPLAKVGYQLGKSFNLKFILDLHENWPVLLRLSPHTKKILGRILVSYKQWERYEEKYTKLSDGLVVVAEGMRQRLLKKGVHEKNFIVLPNTSNKDVFDRYNKSNPDPKFITLYYAGGITKHRGLDIVIDGLKKIELPENFRFWIVGKGNYKDFLEKKVNGMDLDKYVHFLGWRSHNEVLELLFKSDIAVIPHLKNEHTDNTSPNKIFHYMMAEKPIISSNCNYLEDIVKRTSCGLVYSDIDSKDFAQKLEILMNDKIMQLELGRNGYQAAMDNYNWGITSKGFIELYNNL